MSPGLITLILEIKCKILNLNMPLLHLPVIATVFWDADETVLTDYLEHGSTITGTYYTDLIRKVWEALKKKQEQLYCRVLFHQNNTSPHMSSQRLAVV